MIRTTVQLITCTVLQNCLLLFSIHYNSHPQLFLLVRLSLAIEPQTFFAEGRHLSKILLAANVTLLDILYLVEFYSVIKIKVHNMFYTHTSIYSELILNTDGSKYK